MMAPYLISTEVVFGGFKISLYDVLFPTLDATNAHIPVSSIHFFEVVMLYSHQMNFDFINSTKLFVPLNGVSAVLLSFVFRYVVDTHARQLHVTST